MLTFVSGFAALLLLGLAAEGESVSLVLGVFAAFFPMIALLYRLSTTELILRQDGVVVRNVFSKKTFDWSEISRIELGSTKLALLLNSAAVIDVHGNETVIFAIQQDLSDIRKPENSKFSEMVHELNAAVLNGRRVDGTLC